MLESLVEYAKRKGLMVESGFAAKRITWIADIDLEGNLLGVNFSDAVKQRSRLFPACPDFQQPELASLPTVLSAVENNLEFKQAAQFLADTCETIVLLSDEEKLQRNQEKHKTFVHLITRASHFVPELEVVLAFFWQTKQVELLQQLLTNKNAKPFHLLTFAVQGHCIIESSDWHLWWKEFRKEVFPRESGRIMLCLITGKEVIPAKTHPKLTTLASIGAISFGANLVSFDKAAFGSYQLIQGENSAVNTDDATAYKSALDDLLRDAPIIGSCKIIHWYSVDVDRKNDPIVVLFGDILESEFIEILENILDQLLQPSIQPKPSWQTAQFHFAVVSATQGRAAIKLYLQGSIKEATQAILTWFNDFCIIQSTGIGNFTFGPIQMINSILESLHLLNSEKARDSGRFTFQTYLWQICFNPKFKVPIFLVEYCVKTICTGITARTFAKAMDRTHPTSKARNELHMFMGVLKAYILRDGDSTIGVILNEDHSSLHYQFGRLLALLEVTSNIANRTTNRMNYSHQLLFQAILNNQSAIQYKLQAIQRDLQKIRQTRTWSAFQYEEKYLKIWIQINQSIPTTNTLTAQCLLILGYYQQYANSNNSSDDQLDATDELTSPWEEV